MDNSSCQNTLISHAKENNISISFANNEDKERIRENYISLVSKTCQTNFTSHLEAVNLFAKYPISEPIVVILNIEDVGWLEPTSVAFHVSDALEWKSLFEKNILVWYPIYITNLRVDFALGNTGYGGIVAFGTAADWLIELGKNDGYSVRCYE